MRYRSVLLLTIFLLKFVFAAIESLAQTTSLTNITGQANWENAGNWSAGVPTSTSDVMINSHAISIDFSSTVNSLSGQNGAASLGLSTATTATFTVDGDLTWDCLGGSITVGGNYILYVGGTLTIADEASTSLIINGTVYADALYMKSSNGILTINSTGKLIVTNGIQFDHNYIVVTVDGTLEASSLSMTGYQPELNINGSVELETDMNLEADLNLSTGASLIVKGNANIGGNSFNDHLAIEGTMQVQGNMTIDDGIDANVEGDLEVFQTLYINDNNSLVSGTSGYVNATTYDCTAQGRDGLCEDNITANSSLPVVLLDFRGEAYANGIRLYWYTASEQNNSHFVVEKSYDGINFHEIAKVVSNGNTNQLSKYNYLDQSSNQQLIYYRLIQVDYDGQLELLKVIVFKNTSLEYHKTNIYPNPVTDRIINIEAYGFEWESVKLINLNGQLLSMQLGEAHSFVVNESTPLGIYLLILTNANVQQVFRIVLN